MTHASHSIAFSMPGRIDMHDTREQSPAHNSIEVTPV